MNSIKAVKFTLVNQRIQEINRNWATHIWKAMCVILFVMQKWVKVYLAKAMENLKRCKNNMEHIVSMKFTIS